MLRRRLMRLVDVAVITIALVFVTGHAEPITITTANLVRDHVAYCVKAVGPHWVQAHMTKRYTRKGVVHQPHWLATHWYTGHRAYCVKARVNGVVVGSTTTPPPAPVFAPVAPQPLFVAPPAPTLAAVAVAPVAAPTGQQSLTFEQVQALYQAALAQAQGSH